MLGKFRNLFVVSLILQLLLLTFLPAYDCQARTTYGIMASNPGSYWSTDGAYVDVLRKAKPWQCGFSFPPLTANGYPTANSGGQIAYSGFTLVGYGPGTVRCNFYGKGIFDLSFGGFYLNNWASPNFGIVPGTLKKTVDSNGVTITTCQIEFNIPQPQLYDFTNGAAISLIFLDNINPEQLPNGYPDDIHLTLPGYPTWQDGGNNPLYTKEYLQAWSPFACFRFMDSTNTSSQEVGQAPMDWSQRSVPNYWGGGNGVNGTPIEDLIDLCNATGRDGWFNVPAQATDNWKLQFAKLVKSRLKPGLHCYVEHGNEMWNWSYPYWFGTNYVYQQSIVDGFYQNYGWRGQGMELAKLLMSDVNIMGPVLGADVLRPVLAGQMGNPDYVTGGLEYIASNYGNPGTFIYAISGATYFGGATMTSVDEAFQDCDGFIKTGLVSSIQQLTRLAAQYGVQKVCAYEGGQGLDAGGADWAIGLALEQDPRMQTLYTDWDKVQQANGMDLVCIEDASGLWGYGGFWADLPAGSMIYNPPLRYLIDSSLANINNPPPLTAGGGGNNGGTGGGGSVGKNTTSPWSKHHFMPSPGMGRKPLPPTSGMKNKSSPSPTKVKAYLPPSSAKRRK